MKKVPVFKRAISLLLTLLMLVGTAVTAAALPYGTESEAALSVQKAAATYTITYNLNGASGSVSSQTKTEGTPITLRTTVPTRTGYTFQGWAKSATGSVVYQPGDTYSTDADLTLYAIWKINTYTVTYDFNGATGSLSPQTKTYGIDLTLRTNVPARTGYAFQGWAKSATGSVVYQPGDVYKTNADLKLYAIWKINTYTVTYDLNGASGSLSAQTKTYGVDLTLRTNVPTRTGYAFQGWAKSATGSVVYQPGDVYTANADLKLYAIWKINTYTVTYDLNGASGSLSSQTKTYGVDLTLRTNVPTRTGYAFQGWAKSATGSVVYQPGDVYTANADLKLYAIWKINTYTVTYDLNGATGTLSSQTKTYGVDLTLRTNVPTRTGYTFQGWAKSATGSVAYQPGDVYKTNADLTLYAIWKINTFTVTYDGNGGNCSLASQTKTYGVDLTLRTGVPTWVGRDFMGWATSATGSVKYQPGDVYTVDANLKLYAIWKMKTYTVTYDLNGASGTLAPQTKEYGKALTLRSTRPTRTGFEFQGWAKSPTGTVTYQPGDTYNDNSDLTLYAKWKATVIYTIQYDVNGGTGSVAMQQKFYDVDVTITQTIPTRKAFAFVGWALTSDAAQPDYLPGDVYSANISVQLYAVWRSTLQNTSSVSSTSACVGDVITLTASGEGELPVKTAAFFARMQGEEEWREISADNADPMRVTYTIPDYGTYEWKIVVSDEAGGSAEKILTVEVPKALTNYASISAESVPKLTMVTVTAQAAGGDGNYSYAFYYKKATSTAWTSVGIKYGDYKEVTFFPSVAGEYKVLVKVKDGTGKIVSKVMTLTSTAPAEGDLVNQSTVSAQSVKKGSEVTISGQADGGSGKYTYAFYYRKPTSKAFTAIGTPFGEDTSVTFKPAYAVEYEVRVLVKDENGTVAVKQYKVNVTA